MMCVVGVVGRSLEGKVHKDGSRSWRDVRLDRALEMNVSRYQILNMILYTSASLEMNHIPVCLSTLHFCITPISRLTPGWREAMEMKLPWLRSHKCRVRDLNHDFYNSS